MQIQFGPCLLQLSQGDITDQRVDAIVNAANSALAGGGGVDGAIHAAGGPTIMEETKTRYPDGCPTGSAVPTSAGSIDCRYILHAVGPIWGGGRQNERTLLKSTYRACLELANQLECQSVAFPAISTGAYRYPADLAATHALEAVREFLIENRSPERVRFVLFSEGMYGAFAHALDQLISPAGA